MQKRATRATLAEADPDVSDGYYALVALLTAILISTVATIVGVSLAMMA
jgi:hypothetical protein